MSPIPIVCALSLDRLNLYGESQVYAWSVIRANDPKPRRNQLNERLTKPSKNANLRPPMPLETSYWARGLNEWGVRTTLTRGKSCRKVLNYLEQSTLRTKWGKPNHWKG